LRRNSRGALAAAGHRILDRRARMPACEIALVARKGRMLVFVGVKAGARRTWRWNR